MQAGGQAAPAARGVCLPVEALGVVVLQGAAQARIVSE